MENPGKTVLGAVCVAAATVAFFAAGALTLLRNLGGIARMAGVPRELASAFDQLKSASVSMPLLVPAACGALFFAGYAFYRKLWKTRKSLALWLLPAVIVLFPVIFIGGFGLTVWLCKVNQVQAGTAFSILYAWIKTGALG